MKQVNGKNAVLLLTLTLTAVSAYSHEGMHGPGAEYDADGDESLSLGEYTAYLKESKQDVSKAASLFAALDTNSDGKLSSAEFARGLPVQKAK